MSKLDYADSILLGLKMSKLDYADSILEFKKADILHLQQLQNKASHLISIFPRMVVFILHVHFGKFVLCICRI